MVTYTDPIASEPSSNPQRRARSLARLAFDGALLLLGVVVVWEVASRSLLLVALAVAACLVGGATAGARFDAAPRQAIASALACCALAGSVLLSTTRLWSPDRSVACVLLLVAAAGVAISAPPPRRAARLRWMAVVVATTVAAGPAWAVWGGYDAISVPDAARLLAVAVAIGGVSLSSRPWWALAVPLGTTVAAVAGLARFDLRTVELLAVAVVGVMVALRWWWGAPDHLGPRGVTAPADVPSRRPITAVVSLLIVVGWLCAVAGDWRAAAVVSAGTVVLTASGTGGWGASTGQGDRKLRSLERVATELARRSQIDALTGLPNRDAFDRRLSEEIERAVRYQQPVAICFVDIDHFKAVNDAHGHAVGDRVLVDVAESLRSSSRTIDVVCRYGGEEFAVIAPGTWTSDAVVLADRLRQRVSLLRPSGLRMSLTVSVGVAGLPEHAADGESLMRSADEALYDAKRAGRDRTVVARPPGLTGRA